LKTILAIKRLEAPALECGGLPPLSPRELARVPPRWVESILECGGLPPLSPSASLLALISAWGAIPASKLV
jgi:hypothetical protein